MSLLIRKIFAAGNKYILAETPLGVMYGRLYHLEKQGAETIISLQALERNLSEVCPQKNTEAGTKSGCRRAAARNAGGRDPAERVSAGAAFAALIAAFYADLIEYTEDVVYFCRGLFFCVLIEDYISLMHHYHAVSVLNGVTQVMSYHYGSYFLFFYDLVSELHDDLGCLRVEGSCMLIEDQEVYRCERCHDEGERLPLSA